MDLNGLGLTLPVGLSSLRVPDANSVVALFTAFDKQWFMVGDSAINTRKTSIYSIRRPVLR